MAACYYLDCSCGKRLRVEPRQAGSQLQCDCGATLEVPTLRGLQALPRAEDRSEQAVAIWTVRQGIASACVVVAMILFGVGIYHWWKEREIHQHVAALKDKTGLMADINASVDKLLNEGSPYRLWQYWELEFKPNTKDSFGDFRAEPIAYWESAIRAKRIERYVWWGAAAAVLACTFLWVKFAPKNREHSTP
jgi:hypothetical protein